MSISEIRKSFPQRLHVYGNPPTISVADMKKYVGSEKIEIRSVPMSALELERHAEYEFIKNMNYSN